MFSKICDRLATCPGCTLPLAPWQLRGSSRPLRPKNWRLIDNIPSSVPTIICNYNHQGNVQPSYRSRRRRVLCPRDERALVLNVQINPRTKAGIFVKMLADKRVLYLHGLKGLSDRESGSFLQMALWHQLCQEEQAKIPANDWKVCGSTSRTLDPSQTVQRQRYQSLMKCMETPDLRN